MKVKLTIYFYVALLPLIIYGYKSLPECSDDVVKIAKRGGLIEGIFQPQDDKPVSTSESSFVFRGILLPRSKAKKVAMKFTRSKNELQMYKYLDAIDNEDVEQFGIPAVYYHGTWIDNNLTMIGMSLLDKTVQEMQHTENIFEHDVNVFIIIRNFILSSKYMHSRGVRHNDITLSNIMIRGQQTFIIDFNLGSKIHEKSTGGTLDFAPRRDYLGGERWPKDDWESFLYSICYSLGVRFKWMELASSEIHIITPHKANTKATMEQIKIIESETLRNFLRRFADEVFFDSFYMKYSEKAGKMVPGDPRFPDYDLIFEFVNIRIKQLHLPKPVMFTWLVEPQTMGATDYSKQLQIPDIARIDDPPKVDFRKLYSQFDDSMKTSAPSSSSSSSSSAQNPISSHKSEKKGKAKIGHRPAPTVPKNKSE